MKKKIGIFITSLLIGLVFVLGFSSQKQVNADTLPGVSQILLYANLTLDKTETNYNSSFTNQYYVEGNVNVDWDRDINLITFRYITIHYYISGSTRRFYIAFSDTQNITFTNGSALYLNENGTFNAVVFCYNYSGQRQYINYDNYFINEQIEYYQDGYIIPEQLLFSEIRYSVALSPTTVENVKTLFDKKYIGVRDITILGYGVEDTEAIQNAYDEGFDAGYWGGYNNGYNEAQNYMTDLNTGVSFITNTLNGLSSILSIQIFPGFTLGLIIFLPLLLGLFLIVLKFIRG